MTKVIKRVSWQDYYYLAKPGIVRGNLLTGLAGFMLASNGSLKFGLGLAALSGLALIIASACVFNNLLDADIDRLMSRTSKRALVTGRVSTLSASLYGSALLFGGCFIIGLYTNPACLAVALFGWFAYVVIYGYFKRRTVYGTLIGTISGATPPVIGYLAFKAHFDATSLVLFLILVFWQMPHFYAIAIYRLSDYKNARIPVWPAVRGISSTKKQMALYLAGFIGASMALTIVQSMSLVYLLACLALGTKWVLLQLEGQSTKDNTRWAKHVFKYSTVVLAVLSLVIGLNHWLSWV